MIFLIFSLVLLSPFAVSVFFFLLYVQGELYSVIFLIFNLVLMSPFAVFVVFLYCV